AEGGLEGSSNYMGDLQGFVSGLGAYAERPESLLGETSYAHYDSAWAWATNAPFPWTKQVASHLGGTRNAMVLSWPARVRDAGGLRAQFAHVNDVTPTILEAVGIPMPERVDGVRQRPMDGTSLVYSFDDAAAPERHPTQYFEIYGNRAIYHEGWMASAFRGRVPWEVISAPRNADFAADRWELYDLRNDFSQSRDLAAAEPAQLRRVQRLFDREAAANSVSLHNPSPENMRLPSVSAGRTRFSFHEGAIGIAEREAPNTRDRSHVIEARITVPDGGARGVVATLGGRSAGWSLYLDQSGVPVYRLRIFDTQEVTLRGDAPLPPGEHRLRYEFATDRPGFMAGGRGRLLVDGREVGSAAITKTPLWFSIDETFDVGLDTGSAPADYRPPFAFTGSITEVAIELR
ncbi:MAG: arylsulfatase, partial [Gammaproteobacteria bacterium]